MSEKTHREPSRRDEIEALDRFLDDLIRDPDMPAPIARDLDPEIVTWARRIVIAEQSQMPSAETEAAAQARVWARVLANAQTKSTVNRRALRWPVPRLFSRTWLRVGLVTAGILVAVILSLYTWASQPASASAQEIIQKAQVTANSPISSGVHSFIISGISTSRPEKGVVAGLTGNEQIINEAKSWYQAPNHWRVEAIGKVLDAGGKEIPGRAWHGVSLSDGSDMWNYDVLKNTVVINSAPSTPSGPGSLSPFGEVSMDRLLQLASTCFDPKVTGSATIAGRATYVVDLGPTKCPSASAPEMNGRLVVWIDKETFFVLKQEQHSTEDDTIITTREVTQIQYNVPIDPAQFTFTPPAGATVADNRPKPAPTTDQFQQQLAQLAKQVEFPIFVPTYLPPGLAPRQPKIDPMMDNLVEISYFPTDEPDKDSMASMMKGLTFQEQRATNSLVARWMDRADPLTIAGNKGWLRRGVRNADGTGSDSAALVLRDGVLVSVSSFAIAPEELVKVAASLQPVPGSHAPLPNPTPPTLAELRRRVAFPIFVPTFVSAGLTPEQPTGGELPGENITIKYHTADGSIALTVVNGTLDCCPGLDMMKSELLKLPNGISAKFANMGANAGGLYLWFEQEHRLISLNSPVLPKDQLLQVAASMSKTADLGKVEEPLARPTPTSLPPLQYKILRPTWFPEPMTVREQRDGDVLALGFDPRPNDAPHSVLTLMEMHQAMISPGGKPDPQTTHERIGGYDVTIIKRGQNCITLDWEVGDLHLTLTNPYDPPGQPRYSCDQLQKIVESIQ